MYIKSVKTLVREIIREFKRAVSPSRLAVDHSVKEIEGGITAMVKGHNTEIASRVKAKKAENRLKVKSARVAAAISSVKTIVERGVAKAEARTKAKAPVIRFK